MTDISGVEHAQLDALASLIRARDAINSEIVRLIGRPASTGNLGEFIASRVFDIHLAATGVHPGNDGAFASGPLAGKTVNIKMYSQDDALLDVGMHEADYYLVLRGPRPGSVKGANTLPFRIDSVYLFEMVALREELLYSGVKVGIATSVKRHMWNAAQIHPAVPGSPMSLSAEQTELLSLFGGSS
jgi:hypothetical protein